MSRISLAGSLHPTTTNTPMDARSRVATAADIYNIQTPAIGGIVYVEDEDKFYVITELETLKVGVLETADGKVKSYRALTPEDKVQTVNGKAGDVVLTGEDIKIDSTEGALSISEASTAAAALVQTVDGKVDALSASTDTRFTTVTESINALSTSTDEAIAGVTASVTDLSTSTDTRFTETNNAITELSTSIDERFTTVNETVNTLSTSTDTRFTEVTQSVNTLSTSTDERIATVTGSVTDLSAAVDEKEAALNASIDALKAEVDSWETVVGPQGPQGERGKPFQIEKTFLSIDDMNADLTVEEGAIVLIAPADTSAEDYGKLYVRTAEGYTFLVDMSVVGAQGIQGPQGVDGLSAYQIWQAQAGNEGKTEAEFLESLKGSDGQDLSAAAPTEFTSWTNTYPVIEVTCEDVADTSVCTVFVDTAEGELQLPYPSESGITKIIKNRETGKMHITFGNNVPVFTTGRINYSSATGGTVVTPDRPESTSVYYGFIQGTIENGIYDTEHLTSDLIVNSSTVTKANAGEMGPVAIEHIPAGSVAFVLVPEGYVAYKDDGIGGMHPFSLDNGTAGTGTNGGHTVLVDGALYNVYGEFTLLNDATLYIYVVNA